VKPKRALIVAVMFVLGGFFACMFVLLRAILRNKESASGSDP
jgi:LPS O-antigen subunit length determinant protein (WzzB/FepE family)